MKPPPRLFGALRIAVVLAWLSAGVLSAEVALPGVFGDHMVLQRNRPVPIYGTAAPGEKITVVFHEQSLTTTADGQGNWEVRLAAMGAAPTARSLTITGSNTIALNDVLVGDVWLCSGQSNMDMGLGACNRKEDIDHADFPGIRSFRTPMAAAGVPLRTLKGNPRWVVCHASTAGGFSAVAFYFARKIYLENQAAIPIGLLVSSVGGTPIDLWLSPEGLMDIPALKPLLDQPVMPNGPCSLSYGMIHPLAPYALKGALWYQGENAEIGKQSPDSYFLKMRAMVQGWKQLWGMDDFPFYYVMIANWGELPRSAAPVFNAGGWDADTRLQQANAMALPHAGCASALDIGDSSMGDRTWDGWHPKDKLEVGERLALWALKNDYGRSSLVASGPVLREALVSGDRVVCSFDHVGSGLMVGSKAWYQPTRPTEDAALRRFVIAGADGQWFPANAIIQHDQVLISSPSVREPRRVSYACWQNPEGCNLYNREGLPAAPFHVEDVTKRYRITASAGAGGAITPAGTRSLLQRMTARYAMVPAAGHSIQDVQVDGRSVGSVEQYTFDPVYADHTLVATFGTTAPRYTITASAGGGGALTPSGRVLVTQGESKVFTISAQGGNQVALSIDGSPLGQRSSFCFSGVRADHTIAVTFSGTVKATAGYGGGIVPNGLVPVVYGANQTFVIAPIPGYAIARVVVDGTAAGLVGSHTFTNVTAAHTIAASFKSLGNDEAGSVPRTEQILFACRSAALPEKGLAGSWPAYRPEGKQFAPIGTPGVESIDGHQYAQFKSEAGDGFSVGAYTAPMVCNGATIVAAVRPVRNGAGASWTSIVDLFYDRLVLGIRNDSGLVCVRRNSSLENSPSAIPDGQITILSLVAQPDGAYRVYANGAEIMSNQTPSPLTSLVPGVAGPFAGSITLGRNAPDGWTAFNGEIGDVFVYSVALSATERRQLEGFIARSLEAGRHGL